MNPDGDSENMDYNESNFERDDDIDGGLEQNINNLNNMINNNEVESVNSYDENEDFPKYANSLNKKLNDIIKSYKTAIEKIIQEIEEDKSMVKILDEHIKSVETQVKSQEKSNEMTKEDITKEKHLIQTVERQIGKLTSSKRSLDDEEGSLQERLNTIQQDIYRANQKLDKYKITMKDKLEELEQWAIAASQKENDNLNIKKYIKQDDMKIKELILHIEKLTQDVNKKANELEKEVTETQASQIEMEKTTEELKRLQNERQDLLDKLLKTEEQIKQRHEELKIECDKYYQNKTHLTNLKTELDTHVKSLNDNIKRNKDTAEELKRKETEFFKTREKLTNSEKELKNIHNDIEIKKGELSGMAKEMSIKNNKINFLKTDLENRRKQLDEAKASYSNKKGEINENEFKNDRAKIDEKSEAERNLEFEKKLKQLRDDLKMIVNKLFERSKALFELREKEANMIGDINNNLSSKKNIRANVMKLENEIVKQEELLYNVDFQIQLMARKVEWIQGKRTKEEKQEIDNETKILEKEKGEKLDKLDSIKDSMKAIKEESRAVDQALQSATTENLKLIEDIGRLELENIRVSQDLSKKIKEKEEVLVKYDLMKLEIKKLYDRLLSEANTVFKQENQLFQLELSIKEREKEVKVHNEILVAEHKAAEEERHSIAMELSQKITRANNLRLKYESIIQKTKKTKEGGKDEVLGEHSQAYYVIKTAQEKEELQRQKDEMDGKIKKCTKDLEALTNTMNNLKDRNDKLKKNLIHKGTGDLDRSRKDELEEKVELQSREMWKMKNEIDRLNRDMNEGNLILKEKETQLQILRNSIGDYSNMLETGRKDVAKQEQKCQRAQKRLDTLLNHKKIDLSNNPITAEIELNKEKLRNIYLKNAISLLCNEIPEMKYALNNNLQEFGIKIPSRPVSEKAASEASSKSIR